MSFVMLGCSNVRHDVYPDHGWVAIYDNTAYYGTAGNGDGYCTNITSMPNNMPIKTINKYIPFMTDLNRIFTQPTARMDGYLTYFYKIGELKYSTYKSILGGETGGPGNIQWYVKCGQNIIMQTGFYPGYSFCNTDIITGRVRSVLGLFGCVNHYFRKLDESLSLI